ncbi:MAG: ATP-dependent DNA ligase [Rhodothermales bacterium]
MSRLYEMAEVAERIAETSRRNEKADQLGAYLATLDDANLGRAARYFAGRLFPLHDQRTVQIGGASLKAAIMAHTHTDADTVQREAVRWGDWGDVAFALWPEQPPSALSLEAIAAFFADLARISGSTKRKALVTETLAQCSALEAKLLVKLLQGDLRIGMKEGGVEHALARTFGHTIGEVQRANMLTGDVGEVAVLARHNRLAEATMRPFHPVKFMLATAAEDEQEVERLMPLPFVVEDKYDGIRAQVHLAADASLPRHDDTPLHGAVHEGIRIALFSRTLDAIASAFPEIMPGLAALYRQSDQRSGLILDGELIPYRDGQVLPFQTLQRRLGRKRVTPALLDEAPVAFFAYDVLYADGRSVLDLPFHARRDQLEALAWPGDAVLLADSVLMHDVAHLDAAFDAARARSNEGLMVKHPDAPYKPGRRGRDWLKVKRALGTLDVVVTSVEVGSGKRRHLLSDYTFAVRKSAEDETLLNVGKAYSGLTDVELEELTAWFKAHTRQQFAHGKVRVVDPEIVLEVAFDNVQPSPRHKSGYALRFPRILRLRPDKPASEIDTLADVAALAHIKEVPA